MSMSNELKEELLDFSAFLGVEKEPKMKRSRVAYKNTIKEEKTKKGKKDYVNKTVLYDGMVHYIELREKINSGNGSDDTIAEFKKLRDTMVIKYHRVAKHLVNSFHFRLWQKADREDMVNFAVLKALSIGVEGRRNYGKEYWTRFDIENNDNVFAFWTTQIKNFFWQYVKDSLGNDDFKWDVLENIKGQFEYDNINKHGCPSASFYYNDIDEDE